MTNLVLNTTRDAAIKELATFIEYAAHGAMVKGWTFRPTDQAPESYKALKAATVDNGTQVIPVADYGCDSTIYGKGEAGKHLNILFRFWHDVTHLELDSDFSQAGEYRVINQHLKDARAYGLSDLAMCILRADTIGQVDYYFRHGQFVGDQAAFVDSCIQHGIRKAISVKH